MLLFCMVIGFGVGWATSVVRSPWAAWVLSVIVLGCLGFPGVVVFMTGVLAMVFHHVFVLIRAYRGREA